MKTHIISNGVVVNTILATVAEAQASYPDATCIDGADGGVGWTWDGTALTPPAVVIPPDQLIAEMTTVLEGYYDSVAQKKDYSNRITCAMRAGYEGPYQAEGAAFASWMDSCIVIGYQVRDAGSAGTRAVPTREELIAMMPEPPW